MLLKTILFGVTTPASLKLLGVIPERMAEDGWHVHVVGASSSFASYEPQRRIEYHAIRMRRAPSPLQDLKALILWVSLVTRLRPDIVSVGTPKAAFLAMVASILLRVRVRVYMLRGLRLESSSGLERKMLFLFEKLCSILSTNIIAVSESLKEKYTSLKLADEEKVIVLGHGSSHGVDTSPEIGRKSEESVAKIRELITSREQQQPVVGFVGRFSRDKGAYDLLECKKYLDENGISHRFLIVGAIEDCEEVLEEMNATGEEVVSTGEITDTVGVYSLLDLLLLPTKREGFPNVVLEAAVFGVPCVTYRVTGAIDAVIHNQTGVLIDRDDVATFVRATADLATNPIELHRLGNEARRVAQVYFDQELVARSHIEYYRDLLLK